MLQTVPSLHKRKGTFVTEADIKEEAVKLVAAKSNLSENQMNAAVIKKHKTTFSSC